MLGVHSPAELLTVGPRLTGSPQGSLAVGRVATQRSRLPDPPGRPEQKYSSSPSAEIFGPWSEDEVLKGGPRFVGSPKTKSAFATSAVRPNVKTNTSKIVFFIFSPFQKLLIFSRRTLCIALFIVVLLLKNQLFGFAGSILVNAEMKANERFFLNFLSINDIIYMISFTRGD
jgi:hypothetical protein